MLQPNEFHKKTRDYRVRQNFDVVLGDNSDAFRMLFRAAKVKIFKQKCVGDERKSGLPVINFHIIGF